MSANNEMISKYFHVSRNCLKISTFAGSCIDQKLYQKASNLNSYLPTDNFIEKDFLVVARHNNVT